MSYFFAGNCILTLLINIPLPLFISLCVFINNVLLFAYNKYHKANELATESVKIYRNRNANNKTICRCDGFGN